MRFASELRHAWSQDPSASAFTAPSFLEAAIRELGSDATAIFARGLSDDGRTAAFWPLLLDRRGVLRFIQDEYADHCTCSAIGRVDHQTLGDGLAEAVRQVRPRGVLFKNIPPWGSTLQAVREGLTRSGWSHRAVPATPCPVITVDPGPGAAERFRKEIDRHKRVKSYYNRLSRERDCVFEVFDNDDSLEEWADQFCDIHEWRWNRTPTPSRYRSSDARATLIRNLKAWHADRLLMRFSIRIGGEPIAAVVGLLSRDRLVYHHVVTAPAWQELRAGHVLIRAIALWASDHHICTLDFGAGGEEYKRRYANHEDMLTRLYAGRSRASSVFIRGGVEATIRRSPPLSAAWNRWINRLLRGEAVRACRAWQAAVRVIRKPGLRRAFAAMVEALPNIGVTGDRRIVYQATGRQRLGSEEVSTPRMFDVLRMLDREIGLSDSRRAALLQYRYCQARPFSLAERGSLTCLAWLRRAAPGEVPDWFGKERRIWWIEHCVTTRDAADDVRPRVFAAILATIAATDLVLISAPRWDRRLRRAIVQTGFQPVAVQIRRGRRPVVFEQCPAPLEASGATVTIP